MEIKQSDRSAIELFQENSLSDIVRHEIERLILSGALEAGSRLNENALALKFGVSRGTVREASRALVDVGLVQLIPRRGAFIRKIDEHDIEEVYDLRAGLTGLAGFLLASVIVDEQVDDLRDMLDRMDEAANDGDGPLFNALNLEFHTYIVRSTGNSRLIRAERAVTTEFKLFRKHGVSDTAALLKANVEHRVIVDALAARDPVATQNLCFRHVAHGKERMMGKLHEIAAQEKKGE